MKLDVLGAEVMSISREVGKFISSQKISASDIESKSLNNFVSRVDKEAEEKFIAQLSKLLPEAGFIAEEGTAPRTKGALQWIVDPLDGTTNFIHDIPFYCTSVGLVNDGEPLIGVIYNPVSDNMFSCHLGTGSFMNGSRIDVSSADTLADSLLATGFPYDDFGRQESYMNLLTDVCKKTRGVRRLGSAALDLAYVACGKFDAFYEYALNPWDVAAGVALVKEAGGVSTQFNGDADAIFGSDILSSNGRVHGEMQKLIELHF